MKLILNNEHKTSKSVLTEAEYFILPHLINLGIVKQTNSNYHYVDSTHPIYKFLKNQISLLSELI